MVLYATNVKRARGHRTPHVPTVSVSGRNFVTAGGVISLKGVQHNLFTVRMSTQELMSHLGSRAVTYFTLCDDAWFGPEDFSFLKAHGFNSFRMRFGLEDADYDLWTARMLSFLTECDRNGMYVILAANPPTDWSTGAITNFAMGWARMATMTNIFSSCLGYDIMNEPKPPPDDTIYRNSCHQVMEAIRAISSKPIFYATPFTSGVHMFELEDFGDNQAVYAPHFYAPTSFTHDRVGTYPSVGFDKESQRTFFNGRYTNFLHRNNVPTYLGEFGCRIGADGQIAWVSDVSEFATDFVVDEEVCPFALNYFRYVHNDNPDNSFALMRCTYDVENAIRALVLDHNHTFTESDFDDLEFSAREINAPLVECLS